MVSVARGRPSIKRPGLAVAARMYAIGPTHQATLSQQPLGEAFSNELGLTYLSFMSPLCEPIMLMFAFCILRVERSLLRKKKIWSVEGGCSILPDFLQPDDADASCRGNLSLNRTDSLQKIEIRPIVSRSMLQNWQSLVGRFREPQPSLGQTQTIVGVLEDFKPSFVSDSLVCSLLKI